MNASPFPDPRSPMPEAMPPLRLFIAVDPPAALGEEIAGVLDIARARLPGWRWMPPENFHLTLRFLGEVAAARAPEVAAGLTALAAGWRGMTLRANGWGVFPGTRQARVLWLGLDDGGALAAMAVALNALPAGAPPETRPFQPHLTVARARLGVAVKPTELARLPVPQTPWPVERVRLMASTLTPAGAVYQVVGEFPMAGVSG